MLMDFLLSLVCFVAEILFALTGEIILFIVTLGRHSPRWDLYASERPQWFVLFSEVSTWIGIVFWLTVAVVGYCVLTGKLS